MRFNPINRTPPEMGRLGAMNLAWRRPLVEQTTRAKYIHLLVTLSV